MQALRQLPQWRGHTRSARWPRAFTCQGRRQRSWTCEARCEEYDVVIVGAGHAGCEAALASARLGCRTLLLTLTLDKLAWQPCNPAIGGPAKSQLVFEVDALGGEMGKMADRCYLQKRVLNRSKGPAVWALRAQTDKVEYSHVMRRVLEEQRGLDIREGMVTDLVFDVNDAVCGVETYFGMSFKAQSVVLTTGTFMNGVIWVGQKSLPAGRAGEAPSHGLSDRLVELGFETGRLKTGTPPRVDARTIDFTKLEPQPGDADERWFSFDPNTHVQRDQLCCYITRTNPSTHAIIRENLTESPIYGGWVDSKGPRYCPSIEDKIVRFSDKQSHQVSSIRHRLSSKGQCLKIFLEPESRTTPELYVQGFSTGLPESLQLTLLRTLPGFERVRMLRPAYAVEYDYLPAYQCHATLQTKKFKGLFFSGQINGTTGYEEAAAQGLIAGINAARNVKGETLVSLTRESSYIGTLIDDLVTKDLREPYRILTSRSEYRLLLRSDNADQRLTGTGREIGLISDDQWDTYLKKQVSLAAFSCVSSLSSDCSLQKRIDVEIKRLGEIYVEPKDPICQEAIARTEQNISGPISLKELLKRPHIHYDILYSHGFASSDSDLSKADEESIEIGIKYEGFIRRQERQVATMKAKGSKVIPDNIDYPSIGKLSLEAREHLQRIRPKSIGQASMIGGVSPADITALLIHLEVHNRQELDKITETA